MSDTIAIEIIPVIIAVISGVIMSFLEKPTIKYFCILLSLAGFFYCAGLAVEHFSYLLFSENSNVDTYIRPFYWVMAFLLAALIVLLRFMKRKAH